MKKLLLILVTLSVYCNAQAQAPAPTLSGLDSLFASGDAYYSQFPDSLQKRGRKAHKRWKQFWSVRGVHYPDSGQDHFSPYMFAMGDFIIESQQLPCEEGPGTNLYDGNWALKGPKTMPSQNQGLVESIWANPNTNPNDPEILAGVTGGGLWKKEENSNNWVNLTDNSTEFLGTMSVSAIAVEVNPLKMDSSLLILV